MPTLPTKLVVPIEQIAWLANQGFNSVGGTAVIGGGNVAKFADAVITATAIAMVESGGNALAHNTNAGTGDDSYGLWQINMIGNLKAGRLLLFGIISSDALLDPLTNAQAMAKLYMNKGRSFKDWTGSYNNGKYKQFLPQAKTAYANMKPFGQGQGKVDVVVGGELLKAANTIFGPIFDFIKQIGLRIAGFVGGGLLLIVAIVLYVKNANKI